MFFLYPPHQPLPQVPPQAIYISPPTVATWIHQAHIAAQVGHHASHITPHRTIPLTPMSSSFSQIFMYSSYDIWSL